MGGRKSIRSVPATVNKVYPVDKILEKVGYQIIYNNNKDGYGVISITWENKSYLVWWENNAVRNNFDDQIIYCPSWAATPIARIVVNNIVKSYKYPSEWINNQIDGQHTDKFYFLAESDQKNIQKSVELDQIMDTILVSGFRPDHVMMAEQYGILDGVWPFMNYIYGINIESRKNDVSEEKNIIR